MSSVNKHTRYHYCDRYRIRKRLELRKKKKEKACFHAWSARKRVTQKLKKEVTFFFVVAPHARNLWRRQQQLYYDKKSKQRIHHSLRNALKCPLLEPAKTQDGEEIEKISENGNAFGNFARNSSVWDSHFLHTQKCQESKKDKLFSLRQLRNCNIAKTKLREE